MSAGRPTDYSPEFCDDVIKLSQEGKSRYEICAALGIAMSTFTKWRDEYQEFSVAVERGDTFYKSWLMSRPAAYQFSAKFNDKAWQTLMRFNCRLTALQKAKTYQEQHDAVLTAVADGEMLPDDGSKLISSIGARIKIDEATEVKDRLAALENDK